MNWDEVIGQDDLKKQLQQSIDDTRVGQSYLFVGQEGHGVLPLILAFSQEILKRENPTAEHKMETLNHMDFHFSFPSYVVNGKNVSENFIAEFRDLVLENPYFSINDWGEVIGVEKQLSISVAEMSSIMEKMTLKSYEGGHKILVIWRADKMNTESANKFLKLLEEPPQKTLIFLTAETLDGFLPTIISRTQVFEIPRIANDKIKEGLDNFVDLNENQRETIVHKVQGNWNDAYKLAIHDPAGEEFEDYFIKWVRDAFMVVKNPSKLREIMQWATEVSSWSKEKQKKFLEYCGEIFRMALFQNYAAENLVYTKIDEQKLKWEKFAQYIHGANIEDILTELSTANLHITRNGNVKIIWTDLGIKMSRYLHRPAASKA